MDRVGIFLNEKTPRRALALACFLGLIVLFRHLLLLVVLFVAFAAGLTAASEWLGRLVRIREKFALLALLVAGLGLVAAFVALGAGEIARALVHARDTFPERIAAIRALPLYQRFAEHLPGSEAIVDGAKHYASNALQIVAAIGHFVAYALIALVLAILFVLERHELVAWRARLGRDSLVGTLARWCEHVADAVNVTVQLQVIVAVFNTVLTLPLLFLLGIDHKVALMLLIFVSALVPVVGNVISGTILSVLAYVSKGWLGVGLFVGLTFVLHKIEAYYLNPRLTARHVALPGFLLVVSLVAWEHLLGFAGLFLSFPVLFVAGRIRAELREEDAAAPLGETRGSLEEMANKGEAEQAS